MLDRETKLRIDNARDTLVGKLPDPKSQVEQITIALIYKFMNDMDHQTEEYGGKRTFFAGEFEKYRWAKLMSPGMGGHEMLNLYAEAIARMNENPGIPQLFRDIFKSAFLPYRDPETLRLFLKIIDEFRYDHPERLGDAFEYLLAVLGSQGDAGQFRTPRHIIDFMVQVVNPKKNEIILDPACGTGGFLISSYKHIRQANAKNGKPGAALSPSERKRLAKSISGYDISPDMVRLSLVNMFLHEIREPRIHEYDTLTSEDRWNETADVILANPPFMSPRGGIRPHSRFSIEAKRSEVLFVDYIAEHLSSRGRAAVIVPEGIIFQSGKAYKQLRKMLVEEYLVAVVSLPMGVFKPYSGVKTSILFMDKFIAKRASDILFVRLENDGYDLGDKRLPIDKNDLPQSVEQIKTYLHAVQNDAVRDMQVASNALVVAKDKINESVDWNLRGSLYRESVVVRHSDYPVVKLGEVILEMKGGGTPSRRNSEYFGGDINWCVVKDIQREISTTKVKLSSLGLKNSSAKIWPVNSIIISLRATIGKVGIAKTSLATNQGLSGIVVDEKKILPEYLFRVLEYKEEFIQSLATGVTIKEVRPSKLQKFLSFPLPPLEIQREIIAELNSYQKIIDGARQVVENYAPRVAVDSDWPTVELGEVCDTKRGTSITKKQATAGSIPVIAGGQQPAYFHNRSNREGDIITVSGSGAYAGFVNYFQTPIFASDCTTIKANKEKGITKFFYYLLKGMQETVYALRTGMAQPHVYPKNLQRLEVPLPPLKIQRKIVAEIEEEEKLINANKTLIHSFEQKIKAKIAALWGE